MKFTLLCIFFLLSAIYAQDCTNVTYTGEPLNCTTIDGFLAINHSSSDNVDGLINVTTVKGELYIHRSNLLTNLNGLSNLVFADQVVISDNDVLGGIVLPGLENTNLLRIVNNLNLTSVNLPKLKAVNGNIYIMSKFNPMNVTSTYIKELKMESLTVAGRFEIKNSLFIMKNTPLLMETNFNSLTNVAELYIETIGPNNFNNWKLAKIGGSLTIQNIRNLTSISMDSLTSVNGSITFMYNDELNEVKLQNLDYISGSITCKSNSDFCLVPTMFGANLANCTAFFTCNDSHFDTCRTCNQSYYGPLCNNLCNCTSAQYCYNGLNGNGDCSDTIICKDNEIDVVGRCVEKMYVGLAIGGAALLVIIIIVIIVVAVRSKNKYQKLQ